MALASFRFFTVLFMFMALSTFAHAKEGLEKPQKPKTFITAAMSYGVSMKSGTALPPVIVHGAGVLVPLSGGWGYYGEVAMATAFTEFKPGLQLITGPSKKLGDKLSFGITGMYKLQPLYDGTSPPMHIVGASVAPIFTTSFGAVSIPMGAGHNISTGDTSIVINFKASVRL